MEIKNAFTIDAPYREVWDALLDVERVAPCMPGAAIEERLDDHAYKGRFKIKVGPVTAAYRGRIEIAERDDDRGVVVMRGAGSDAGGAGTANATITSTVRDLGERTEVAMVTDLDVTGRIAQFGGRGSMMQSIADRMVNQFADRLRDNLLAPSAPEPESPPETNAASLHGGVDRNGTGSGAAAGQAPPASAAPASAPEGEAFDAGGLARELLAERAPAALALTAVLAFVLGLLVGRRRAAA